jgi:7-cyano-7-deazaguanine synthase
MENCNKVCISLSGGLDSTMLLMHYLARGFEVRSYSFDYGQKHDIELKKVKDNIKFLQEKGLPVSHQVINLRDAFSDSASSLYGANNEKIPEGDYKDENMKSTVVENRNVIFSSIIYGKALGWANKTQSNVLISLGIHAGDHTIYPDTTPESQSMARELFRISNWGSERVDYEAPFVNLHKDELLTTGVGAMRLMGFQDSDIETVLTNTHSCYTPDSEGRSCGKCGTCVERLEAFEKAHMIDPIPYV